jgi:hypothetical protein
MSKNASSATSLLPLADAPEDAFDLGTDLVEAMQDAVAHAHGKISLPTRVHLGHMMIESSKSASERAAA